MLYKISKENTKNITFLLHRIHLYQKQKFNWKGKSTICGGQDNDIFGGGSGDDILYYDNFLLFLVYVSSYFQSVILIYSAIFCFYYIESVIANWSFKCYLSSQWRNIWSYIFDKQWEFKYRLNLSWLFTYDNISWHTYLLIAYYENIIYALYLRIPFHLIYIMIQAFL